jgi:hypothetical protein
MRYIIVTQEIQDGEHRYTINYLDAVANNQDLQEEIHIRRKEYNDDCESDKRALRHFDMTEISEEEYNILNKYL